MLYCLHHNNMALFSAFLATEQDKFFKNSSYCVSVWTRKTEQLRYKDITQACCCFVFTVTLSAHTLESTLEPGFTTFLLILTNCFHATKARNAGGADDLVAQWHVTGGYGFLLRLWTRPSSVCDPAVWFPVRIYGSWPPWSRPSAFHHLPGANQRAAAVRASRLEDTCWLFTLIELIAEFCGGFH